LEYIHDYKAFIQNIATHSQSCVLSYCSTKYISSQRRRFKQNWVNDLEEAEVIRLFERQNFTLQQLISQENSIFLFQRNTSS